MMRRWILIIFCAIVSVWQYTTLVLASCFDCQDLFSKIVTGDMGGPWAYRVLTPTIIVGLGNTMQVWAAFHLVMLVVFFSLLWLWVEHWSGNGDHAVALATIALSLMYSNWHFSAFTIVEWSFWLAGLLLMLKASPESNQTSAMAIGVLIAVGTANREMTAVLLLTSWVALKPRCYRLTFVYGLIAATVYGAIRLYVGEVENPYTISYVFSENMNPRHWQHIAIYGVSLIILMLSSLSNRRWLQPDLKRLMLVVMAAYLPLWAFLAIWQETRLWMPAIILLLPLITHSAPSLTRRPHVSQESASGHTSIQARWETAGQTAAPQRTQYSPRETESAAM